MLDIQLSYKELAFYVTIANIVFALLLGILPLIASIRLNKQKHGVYGLVATLIGGAVLGIFFSFPLAAYFTWFICRKESAISENENAVS